MFLYVLLALLMLGIMILVHEAGHFFTARACGIPVKEFAIGFGPKLWERQSPKTGTTFSLRPIPLGGFCMFYGDTDDDPNGEMKEDPRCYNNYPAWKRLLTIAAGPLTNLLVALLVAFLLMACWGAAPAAPMVYSVVSASPAETAGLEAGDVILFVNGQDMAGKTATEMVEACSFDGSTIQLSYRRGEEEKTAQLIPTYSEEEGRYLMGVTLTTQTRSLYAGEIPAQAWELCKQAAVAIVKGLASLFQGANLFENASGPVGVISTVAEQTQAYGISQYLYIMVVLSINLGLFNLLPIPALDGAHIIFILIEMIFRKPVPQKVQSVIHLVGYALLIALMLVITGNDILRLFQ